MITPREIKDVPAVAGLTLIAAGILSGLGALLRHLAWALPLHELPTRPGMTIAILLLLAGIVLARMARGRPDRRASEPTGTPLHRRA